MSCNNGRTFVQTCIPAPGGTTTESTYVIDLLHYLCGNRKVCINGYYPLTANLQYRVVGTPQPIGNGLYNCDILITGQVTYMPYRCGQSCNCGQCPITDNIYATVSVPVASATIPTLTGGDVVEVIPANVKDCCNVANAVGIKCSCAVATA